MGRFLVLTSACHQIGRCKNRPLGRHSPLENTLSRCVLLATSGEQPKITLLGIFSAIPRSGQVREDSGKGICPLRVVTRPPLPSRTNNEIGEYI